MHLIALLGVVAGTLCLVNCAPQPKSPQQQLTTELKKRAQGTTVLDLDNDANLQEFFGSLLGDEKIKKNAKRHGNAAHHGNSQEQEQQEPAPELDERDVEKRAAVDYCVLPCTMQLGFCFGCGIDFDWCFTTAHMCVEQCYFFDYPFYYYFYL